MAVVDGRPTERELARAETEEEIVVLEETPAPAPAPAFTSVDEARKTLEEATLWFTSAAKFLGGEYTILYTPPAGA